MFNMSSIVLDNSFKMLSPFIDALVNKNVCDSLSHSQPPKQVTVDQYVLKMALQVNFGYLCFTK